MRKIKLQLIDERERNRMTRFCNFFLMTGLWLTTHGLQLWLSRGRMHPHFQNLRYPSWPLRPTDWGGDNTGWIRSRPQEALHTSAHPSFFPKRAGIWVARWWQRQGSVSLLAHPKPADPQQEKCQTEEVIVACSALALCWVMQAHGWAQVRRTTQLVCGSPSNNNRLFKPLSFGIACYLGKLTGPTFLSAPK